MASFGEEGEEAEGGHGGQVGDEEAEEREEVVGRGDAVFLVRAQGWLMGWLVLMIRVGARRERNASGSEK